jgi:hypothetical protein
VQRPPDIDTLGPVLDRLVTRGGTRVPQEWSEYLANIGVAVTLTDDGWMCPSQHFLRYALPASDTDELVRRTVIRDPKYRLHVDLCLCCVVHSVAVSERWNRLEELLFGPCRSLAPRLAQLQMWLARKCRLTIREIQTSKLQQVIDEHADPSFVTWGKTLWGESRAPADLFPLLLDLYVPLTCQAFHVAANVDVNQVLLASLIATARDGEGLSLSSNMKDDLNALQDLGLPICVESRTNETLCAYVVGTIEAMASDVERIGEPVDIPSGLSDSAKRSRLVPHSEETSFCLMFKNRQTSVVVPVSVDHDASRWPAESIADAPGWLRLPGSALLSTAARQRKDSQDADEAIEQVASHPLYGFLLQLLLLEALDRELGEETLALALPQNRKIETAEDWAETKVLYRPRDESKGVNGSSTDGFLVLGSIDDVFPTIAHEVGILGIATPYATNNRPWSRAVYLMSTAGVVDGRPHSWRLTITHFFLDRLHSGSLMKNVIRNGRGIREQMHHVLLTLWKEHATNTRGEQVPA